jgi:CheY-like chemotaxis protein
MTKKIVVIDDEKPTLSMFRLFLGAYGYEVFTAENGTEGLAVVEREDPPIVLTDIKMPGMDGIEVLRRLKKLRPRTQVVVITGHGDMDLAIQALNLGAADFVNKPIQKADLDAALRRAEERILTEKDSKDAIVLREQGEVTVMSILGNLTSASEPDLRASFEQIAANEANGGGGRIVIRFSESASINGAGIAILMRLLEDSHGSLKIAITGLSDNFRKVFNSVGIAGLARICHDEAEALASLADE